MLTMIKRLVRSRIANNKVIITTGVEAPQRPGKGLEICNSINWLGIKRLIEWLGSNLRMSNSINLHWTAPRKFGQKIGSFNFFYHWNSESILEIRYFKFMLKNLQYVQYVQYLYFTALNTIQLKLKYLIFDFAILNILVKNF